MIQSLGLAIALLFCFNSTTYAYSLGDHQDITRAATAGLMRCIENQAPSPGTVQRIIDANLREDLNFVRKWFQYSHFYHPEHDLKSARLSSRDRVLNLERRLGADPEETEKETLFGKAIHHLQDMTVPPHVIPVNHFWTDGFEKMEVSIRPTLEFSSCEALFDEASRKSLSDLHQETAEETYALVQSGFIVAEQIRPANLRQARLPLTLFWNPGADREWGSYGSFGNAYGAEWLKTRTHLFRVSLDSYASLKRARLQAAVRATQLAFVRVFLLGM